jgi:hypothetical protein
MTEPTETRILACVPVGVPGYHPGPDHTETACDRCRRPVWIGPRQRLLRGPGVDVLCAVCVARVEAEIARSAGAQLERRVLNPDAASDLNMDEFRRAWERGWRP